MGKDRGVASIIIIILLVAILGSGTFLYFKFTPPTTNLDLPQKTNLSTKSPTISPLVSPAQTVVQTKIEGLDFNQITWLSSPEKISNVKDVKVFKPYDETNSDFLRTDKATYYKIGTFTDGSIIIDAFMPSEGPSFEDTLGRFIKTPDSKYYYLKKLSQNWSDESIMKTLLPEVNVVDNTIPGLVVPENILIDNKKFQKVFESSQLFSTLKDPQKIYDTPSGSLYEINQSLFQSSQIFHRYFYLKLKDQTYTAYKLVTEFEASGNMLQPKLDDKTTFSQKLAIGCSSSGMFGAVPIIPEGSTILNDKQEVGKDYNGKPIYSFNNPNNELVKDLYEKVYKIGRDYDGGPGVIPIEQFAKERTHILWEDQMGDYQIYLNDTYGMMAECAKPVIYLYPTQEIKANIKVGADITLSEPAYPLGGWDVTAYPAGELIYQGKNYDSLFWEGQGRGLYPNYQEVGTVVSQKELISTLNTQLKQLGLNTKESVDFMEFWQAKLPKTPFVRLTWLGTKDMDLLAPLEVSPAPDTKIRIFLEFEGLDKYKALKPQKLAAVTRKGFTLIEWGGLLIKPQK